MATVSFSLPRREECIKNSDSAPLLPMDKRLNISSKPLGERSVAVQQEPNSVARTTTNMKDFIDGLTFFFTRHIRGLKPLLKHAWAKYLVILAHTSK